MLSAQNRTEIHNEFSIGGYYQKPSMLKSLSTIKIKIYIAICQVYVPYIYKITLPTSNCHKSFHHYCQPQLILTHSTSLSKH